MNAKKKTNNKVSIPFAVLNNQAVNRIIQNVSPALEIPKVPAKAQQQQQEEQMENKLRSRIIDNQGMSQDESDGLVSFYSDLAPLDLESPISVVRVKNFLENFVKNDSPEMYKTIKDFYGMEIGCQPISPIAEKQTAQKIIIYMRKLRTIKNALEYSLSFSKSAEKIATKLNAPRQMGTLERIKWLKLWFVLLRDNEKFWGDFNEKSQLVSEQYLLAFNRFCFYPEFLITVEKIVFSTIEDGSILLEAIQKFVSLCPPSIQKKIYRFAELDKDEVDESNIQILDIRKNLKSVIYQKPWLTSSSYFLTTSGIAKMPPAILEFAVNAHFNGLEKLPSHRTDYVDVLKNIRKPYNVYLLGESNGTKYYASCDQEIEMFMFVYEWLCKHPDFKFGVTEKKTISEYGLDILTYDSKKGITAWILENGFANSEKDINWELAEKLLQPEKNYEIFFEYYSGEVSSTEVLQHFGFKDETAAQICLSFSGLFKLEKSTLEPALKRLQMFGLERGLAGDKLYLELYKFLLKSELPCGRRKKPISSYGIRYTF